MAHHMDLILWRHAEAEDTTPDAKRKLTAHGEKQAKRMAHWLKERLPEEIRILSSPALRCIQTAQALGLHFEESPLLTTAAAPPDLLTAANWPHAGGTVLLIGHQPTLGQTAALLLSSKQAAWSIKKGAVWWLSWRDGDVVLRATLGPDLV